MLSYGSMKRSGWKNSGSNNSGEVVDGSWDVEGSSLSCGCDADDEGRGELKHTPEERSLISLGIEIVRLVSLRDDEMTVGVDVRGGFSGESAVEMLRESCRASILNALVKSSNLKR